MAPVTRSRDRGQLILVAGLTVAVILVMLVLLLNTVIYTENLATRGIDSGAGDALEYRATVVGSVEELIEWENEHYDEGHPPKEFVEEGEEIPGGVNEGIDELDEYLAERYLYRGVIAEIRSYKVHDEANSPFIWQDEPSQFTPYGGSGEEPWTIAETTDIERYEIRIDDIELNQPFLIYIDEWVLKIEKVEREGDIEFVININGSENDIVENEEPIEIDLIRGTINDRNVEDYENIDEYDEPPFKNTLQFENGDAATGTFVIHAKGNPNEGNLKRYNGDAEEGPYYTYPVEKVTNLQIHYETTELRFVTTVDEISPEGEP